MRRDGTALARNDPDRGPTELLSAEAADSYGLTGWLALVMAAGTLVIALAYNAARREEPWAPIAFWVGLLVIVIPASARLLAPRVHRKERLSLVIGLGLAFYMVSLLRNPIAFTSYDELVHLRTLLDILRFDHLFAENPMLLVSPFYPGMEAVAAAIAQISGLDPWTSAVVLMGVIRVLFVLAAFLLFESVSGSAWIAGAASLIYMSNPGFIFFNGSFIYEAFALPFAITILWLLARRQSTDRPTDVGLTLVVLTCLMTVVVSHHVTAVALVAALVVWSAVLAFARWRHLTSRPIHGVGGIAAIAFVAALGWALYVATETFKYLGSPLLITVDGLFRILTGQASTRTLFDAGAAGAPPIWERVVSISATLTIVALLPIGLVFVWRRYRRRPAALLLGIVSMAFPGLLVFRFTSSAGLEAASRASTFVFVGVAFVIALVLSRLTKRLTRAHARFASPLAVGLVTLFFAGGIALGTSWWERLPGPFLVGGESRSISPQGTAAATWTLSELGPDNRIAADRSNRLLLGSYGHQRVVFDGRDPIGLWPLYSAPTIDASAADIIQRGDIDYLLVDRRLATALPIIGIYFDQGEADLGHQTPIPADSLAKFDRDPRVDRIYDNGDIQIYDTSRLTAPAP